MAHCVCGQDAGRGADAGTSAIGAAYVAAASQQSTAQLSSAGGPTCCIRTRLMSILWLPFERTSVRRVSTERRDNRHCGGTPLSYFCRLAPHAFSLRAALRVGRPKQLSSREGGQAAPDLLPRPLDARPPLRAPTQRNNPALLLHELWQDALLDKQCPGHKRLAFDPPVQHGGTAIGESRRCAHFVCTVQQLRV
jgi:hypothetical protein